jgi:hypothetical protein
LRDRGTLTLYLDGMPQTSWSPGSIGGLDDINTRAFVYSPDSKHIAYFDRCSNPAASNDAYLCCDDKAVRLGGTVVGNNLVFTPDGNHLLWTMTRPGGAWRAFMDGKPVAEGFGRLSKETWQPGADPGSWMFLLQDNDGLKRVTVTPSPNTSFAALFGR